MKFEVQPIGFVKNTRTAPIDDHWETVAAEIELSADIPEESFDHIGDFTHLEIIFLFDKVNTEDIVFSGRPRGNPEYPKIGIFGQRKKDRPNRIGLTTVELIEHKGKSIVVKYLDAIDGTPVLDIKPVFKEFQPQKEIKQPEWVGDLMKNYWR